jgi:large subunit ribosomal protein L17
MRHKRIGRKLGVTTKHRKSMFRNMVTDLFRFDRIKTTDMKAKELRRIAEKLITLAKEGTLHKRRQAAAYIRDKDVLKRLFDEIAAKFKDRPGGYTRIIKLGFRKGDNTAVSIIELVEEEYKPAKKKKAKTTAKKEQPKTAETGAKGKPKARSSKKESAEELGLIEEGQAAPEAEAVPAESETKPAEQAETPAAQETQPEAEELKAEGAGEGTETAAESEPEAPAGDKKEE